METGTAGAQDKTRLQSALADTRAELTETLGELREVMHAQLDWRAWVTRNPLFTVAVVAAVGYRLGRGRWL